MTKAWVVYFSRRSLYIRLDRSHPPIACEGGALLAPDMPVANKQAGVDIRLCGQGLSGREIDAKDVNPDIQVDRWAMTTIINLVSEGYARIG